FSTAPWRFPELLYPNFGGCQFPQHSRWMSALPNEIAVWVPSLYMGLLPVLLAITAFRFRWRDSLPPDQSSPTQTFSQSETPWNRNPFQTLNDRHVIQVWISWLTIGFLLASMGGFGIVWGIRTVQHIILGTPVPASFVNGDPIGGLYWLLNGLIPKFSLFRYPAKLMTFATFGLAVLAGFGWDFNITNTIQQHNHQKTGITLLQKLIWGLLIFSVCLLVLLGIFKNVFLTRLQITPDSLYGPWQATLCFQSVRNSLIQTVLLTTVLSLLLSPCSFLQDLPTGQNILSRFSRPSKADFLPSVTSSKPGGIFKWLKEKQGIILLLLLVADIYLANRWMIVTVPQKYFDRCPGFVSAIRQKQPPSDHQPPTRILRHPIWFPQAFQQESSTGRISERIIWDRASLFPKYSYRYGIAVIDVRGTMMNNDYYHFSNLIRTHHDIDKTLEFLDVSYRIEPINSKAHLTRYRPVDMNHQKWCPRDTVLLKIQKPTTRIKIIHSGQDSLSAQEKQAESVQILDYTPNRIQYKAKLVKKADLLFVEQYAPGWQVIVTPDTTGVKQNSPDNNINSQKSFSVPVVKSHHFLRKITLPAGTFDITMEYRPQSFYVGLSVTIVTGTLLLLLGIISSVFGILPKR
ncbi:MAG: hypothetical protein IKW74_04015, partial [Thermoguttaceae bacterium]|nr:hypothetical protein [Thermoguttaceae bacterium]